MISLLEKLYPLNRHLVGNDNETALKMIMDELGDLKIHRYPSGMRCWTWSVPERWEIDSSYIECEDGRRLGQFEKHPLHVVTYSLPVNKVVSREELFTHIHVSERNPEAVPYVTRFYERDWGFCLSKNDANSLKGNKFKVFINAKHVPDEMVVGEYTLKGESKQIVVIVTNICHPAQVNDSISGVVVAVDLIKELKKRGLRYTYKFLFLPETIGSIAWLSQNENLIPDIYCGLFFEMLGNNNDHLLQHTFSGTAKIDKIALEVLEQKTNSFRTTAFRKGPASDEMIFDGPGIHKPMINLSRYPYEEYHTSLDTPEIISESRLAESKDIIHKILLTLDRDRTPIRMFKGPVFLSGYGLWQRWEINMVKDKETLIPENKDYLMNIALDYIMNMIDGIQSIFEIYWILKKKYEFPITLEFVDNFIRKLQQNELVKWQES